MRFQALNDKIYQLTTEQDSRKALDAAIEAATEFIKVLKPSASGLATGEDALDEAIPTNQFPNQKVESWFAQHPYFTGERVALKFYTEELVETKFYWLGDSATKARVSAGVMLTPNWEDSDLTRNDSYKVGIDFFLTANTKSLLVAISNHGNLRILEFSDGLSHTQIEILDKLHNVLELDTKEKIHEILWNALALTEVNKKFYAGIAEQFNILLNHLIKDGKDKEDAKLFASRLLGRLLFLWFLRKKDIIDESFGYFDLANADSTEYYEQTLKGLFFQTLNTPVHERQTKDEKTPYLNGGLFEARDNDWAHSKVDFSTGFFNGLYEHLEKYNFTTDESSPEYEQVAIDPEMLGRVFESLLATQLTETGEQARKAKGAFYTPREIVAYMCKESLRQYMYSKFDSDDQKLGIDKLLDTSDADWEKAHTNAVSDLLSGDRGRQFARDILVVLDELKVLDPACGSGAFPMGMLQLVLKTYERLETRFDPYKTKLQIIQNNIYGVDVEPMAIEISRLRAWLSLIVDEENSNNVEPLPNLDFKFVCANSLIPLEEQIGMFADATLHEKLAEVRTKFFNSRKPEMKSKWKEEYYKLTGHGQSSMLSNKREDQLKSFDPFKNEHSAEFYDGDYMFGVYRFDVVIGNPPYVHLEKMKDVANKLYRPLRFKTYEPRGDLYSLFYEAGVNSLKEHGILAYITSNKWMRTGYGASLRDFFVEQTNPIQLIDLGGGIFESATVDTNIVFVKREPYAGKTLAVSTAKDFSITNMSDYVMQNSTDMTFSVNDNWIILNALEKKIKEKIEAAGTRLSDWNIKINRGILTGLNEAFIISRAKRDELIAQDPKSAEIIRPILRGKDIKRYTYAFRDSYLIASHNGYGDVPAIDINDYPAIKKWLDSEEWNDKPEKGTASERLANRTDKGRTPYNLRDCKYMDDFNRQKIMFQEMVQTPCFILDEEGFTCLDTARIITGEDLDLLLAVLNSSLFFYSIKNFYGGGALGDKGIRMKHTFFSQFPCIKFNQEEVSEVRRLVHKAMTYVDSRSECIASIDALIYDAYGFTQEEREIIGSL